LLTSIAGTKNPVDESAEKENYPLNVSEDIQELPF